ncbi:hypothetical protein ACFLTH_05755 [Bacteroidota bacterium]
MQKLIFLLIISVNVFAQSRNPDIILDEVKNKFNIVRDYQVDVNVNLDIDFLKVPETKAKIFFKQPDKIHFNSEGFAMLPRQVFDITPTKLLSFDYTSIYMRDELIENTNTAVIKIIPNSDTTNMLLSTLWIDIEKSIVRKIETATKNSGTILTELYYAEDLEYPLPSEIRVNFKVNNVNIPNLSPQNSGNDQHNVRRSRKLEGTVTLKYSNYIVNEGIPDEMFLERELINNE